MSDPNVKVVLNLQGLNELMKRDEMVAIQERIAGEVAGKANANSDVSGAQYGVRTVRGKFINFTHIEPENEEATEDNYENNTLLKALHK